MNPAGDSTHFSSAPPPPYSTVITVQPGFEEQPRFEPPPRFEEQPELEAINEEERKKQQQTTSNGASGVYMGDCGNGCGTCPDNECCCWCICCHDVFAVSYLNLIL